VCSRHRFGAAKLYPLFLIGALLVLCLRAGKMREWRHTTIAGVGHLGGAERTHRDPVPRAWWEFFHRNSLRARSDSLYNVSPSSPAGRLRRPAEIDQTPTVLNLWSAILFLLCCAESGSSRSTRQTRPRVAQLAFLVVAAFPGDETRCGARSTRSGWCRSPFSRCRAGGCCSAG